MCVCGGDGGRGVGGSRGVCLLSAFPNTGNTEKAKRAMASSESARPPTVPGKT